MEKVLKFIIIGDAETGKSHFMNRFVNNSLQDYVGTSTIGIDFGSRIINIDKQDIKIVVWDTAGQERYKSLAESYYRGSNGVIMFYDISRRMTYNNVKKWLEIARKFTNNAEIFLVGNKTDLSFHREVEYEEAKTYAEDNNLMFAEISVKQNKGVCEVFYDLTRKILHNEQFDGAKSITLSESILLNAQKPQKTSCC